MMTPSATKPNLCSSSQTSGQEDCWDKTEEIDPLTKLLATWLYDIKKKLVAGEMTAPPEPLQQQPEERAGGHRADNGVAATGPDGGEVAVPICLPSTELYYNNVVNYTAMESSRSTMCSLQQCWMEDHNKPNVLKELF